jgi:cytochrome c2
MPVHQALFALTRFLASLVAVTAFGYCGAAFADGDPAKGAAIFTRQCALCHTIGKNEPNRFGPNLFGVTERKAATAPGYEYSPEFITMATPGHGVRTPSSRSLSRPVLRFPATRCRYSPE